MAPELRKRKAPAAAPAPAPKKKAPSKIAKIAHKIEAAVTGTLAYDAADDVQPVAGGATTKEPLAPVAETTTPTGKPVKGGSISLEGFGAEIETHDGVKTTLKQLVDESKSGVVLFTYPKASTPGCTTQACLFRDSYVPLTATGFSIYGLSTDSPKANTTFKEKKELPYPLLCDPQATLIEAIGLKKTPKGTTRGVFVVDKQGKVLLAEPGGPAGTVDAVKALVEGNAV